MKSIYNEIPRCGGVLFLLFLMSLPLFSPSCTPEITGVDDAKNVPSPALGREARLKHSQAEYDVFMGNGEPMDGFNTEDYDAIQENEFLSVLANPLSTFSIDVDTASYSNVRRFINEGRMPPMDAVRIEEFINYFSYSYPEPSGEHPFHIHTEVSDCPWNDAGKLVHIGLKGRSVIHEDLPPSNLVFLLDVSGSMNSPNKLPLLKGAFRLLTEQLSEKDRVAIVVYAGAAGMVLPPTPGYKKAVILEAIDRLSAGGSTAGGEGIRLAYQTAKEHFIPQGNNRVILATDGDFNVGISSDAELVRLIEEKREEGIYLTVLGFGTGNLKDSKMEKLADKGNGNYAYIDGILEAKKVMVSEMGGTLLTIAKDVKIQVEFNPAKVKAYRLIGYENRLLRKEDFADDTKDAGELGAGHTVTALYEIELAGEGDPEGEALKYQEVRIREDAFESGELLSVKFRYKDPDGGPSKLLTKTVPEGDINSSRDSDDFIFSAAVAEFGMLLRDSKFKGSATFDHVLELARTSKGLDKEGYRSEFMQLVEACRLLKESRVAK